MSMHLKLNKTVSNCLIMECRWALGYEHLLGQMVLPLNEMTGQQLPPALPRPRLTRHCLGGQLDRVM